MNKFNKIVIFIIIIFLLISLSSNVFAMINPSDYVPSEQPLDDDLGTKVGIILGVVRNIGVVASVITLMIMGLKYIFGSVEEKANYKQTMFPWVIGCVLLAGSTTLVSFIYDAVH